MAQRYNHPDMRGGARYAVRRWYGSEQEEQERLNANKILREVVFIIQPYAEDAMPAARASSACSAAQKGRQQQSDAMKKSAHSSSSAAAVSMLARLTRARQRAQQRLADRAWWRGSSMQQNSMAMSRSSANATPQRCVATLPPPWLYVARSICAAQRFVGRKSTRAR